MTRKSLLIAAGVVAVALVAGVLGWRLAGGDGGAADGRTPASSANKETARDVARVLASLPDDPTGVLSAASLQRLDGHLSDALPDGSRVVPNASSWAPNELGGGIMAVTLEVPGEPAESYVAVMVREDGAWKLLETVPLENTGEALGAPQ